MLPLELLQCRTLCSWGVVLQEEATPGHKTYQETCSSRAYLSGLPGACFGVVTTSFQASTCVCLLHGQQVDL